MPKKILHGGNEITQVENRVVEEPMKCGSINSESKTIVEHPLIKKEPPRLYHKKAPAVPRATNEPDTFFPTESVYCEDQTNEIQEATLRDFVSLQAKQAELIVDQQRMTCLPAQEPPVFNGNYFDYPVFISAFDSIISRRVTSDKDKLYFLSKYTTGKAHEVVENFLTLILKTVTHKPGNSWPKDLETPSVSPIKQSCETALK